MLFEDMRNQVMQIKSSIIKIKGMRPEQRTANVKLELVEDWEELQENT